MLYANACSNDPDLRAARQTVPVGTVRRQMRRQSREVGKRGFRKPQIHRRARVRISRGTREGGMLSFRGRSTAQGESPTPGHVHEYPASAVAAKPADCGITAICNRPKIRIAAVLPGHGEIVSKEGNGKGSSLTALAPVIAKDHVPACSARRIHGREGVRRTRHQGRSRRRR